MILPLDIVKKITSEDFLALVHVLLTQPVQKQQEFVDFALTHEVEFGLQTSLMFRRNVATVRYNN